MDARGREDSQLRRHSIKRPWEDEAAFPQLPQSPKWHRNTLPPMNAVPSRNPSPYNRENGSNSFNQYRSEMGGELALKRMKHNRHTYGSDHNMLSRENLDLNGRLLQAQATRPSYVPHHDPPELPSFSSSPRINRSERWDSSHTGDRAGAAAFLNVHANNPPLCRRCRQSTGERPELGGSKSCEDCKNDPELAHVAQNAALGLSQLAATLSSGVSSQQRAAIGIGLESSHRDEIDARSAACPPIAEVGLRHTLTWLVERISHVNQLADKLVQNASSRHSPNIDRQYIGQGNVAHDGLMDIMKRRIEPDSDESVKSRDEVPEPILDPITATKRRSIAALTSGDELPASGSSRGYHRNTHSFDGASRLSIMNPPPAPGRQYPSPPGRSLPSPTYHIFPSMPSPSSGSYASGGASVNFPMPSGLHQSALNAYLPPIGHTPDALHAHSTALQHEVALQKIALASLQGEHDKLLQAFSRSQIRANALEKEHSAADSEIITLSEEKLRLQSQVIELERSIKELSRSRDDFRNSAVQENAQYILIVQRASRMEELAGEERKSWNRLKVDMERRIEHLGSGHDRMDSSAPLMGKASVVNTTDEHVVETVPLDERIVFKIESTPETAFLQRDITGELKEEIRQLRLRCAEVEDTLRVVRNESLSMEGIVEALGVARKVILERAKQTLGAEL